MTPSQAIKEIERRKQRILDENVRDLFAELIKVAPVDTGTFRNAYSIDKIANGWRISNNMEYATILWDGRRFVAGKWFGSESWIEGGAPILSRYNSKIDEQFKQIRV